FINVTKMPNNNKSLDRVFYYHIEGGFRNRTLSGLFKRIINKVIVNSKIKRKFPLLYQGYDYFAGSQWWCFNTVFTDYLLEFLDKNKQFVRFYKNTFIPDEMFFQTIIMNSPFANTVEPGLTFTDWNLGKPPYPSLIDNIHFPIIKREIDYVSEYGQKQYLYARKFNDHSKGIIEKIDQIIG
ncbi:beta-1,6-N-acetylglucosaminyltransferase, partial [Terribacillus saccharophilus]